MRNIREYIDIIESGFRPRDSMASIDKPKYRVGQWVVVKDNWIGKIKDIRMMPSSHLISYFVSDGNETKRLPASWIIREATPEERATTEANI